MNRSELYEFPNTITIRKGKDSVILSLKTPNDFVVRERKRKTKTAIYTKICILFGYKLES